MRRQAAAAHTCSHFWPWLPCASQDTFQRAKQWVKELQRQGNPNIVIALSGNKSDLNSKRKVEPEVRASSNARGGPLCALWRVVMRQGSLRRCVLRRRCVALTAGVMYAMVRAQEAESYASDNGIFFMETSAKTATNVNELFVAIGACSALRVHAHALSQVSLV